MVKHELADKQELINIFKNTEDSDNAQWTTEGVIHEIEITKPITEQEIVMPLFTEFRKKLSKWMYLNSESVCGDNMIDVEYLEGHINELLYEMGIYGDKEYEEE